MLTWLAVVAAVVIVLTAARMVVAAMNLPDDLNDWEDD